MGAARPGTVYLVGAGPGDPGLCTVRGRELLETADVVLYDALAPSRLLDACDPAAERIYVGKKRLAPGMRRRTQAEICELMIARARAGKAVVRLKGGDPFTFGRGGEEALALKAAGVRFEVVPGVTAGIAALAYAGIPLTHRSCTSEAVLVTGHEHVGDTRVDWARIAGARTVVLYMGVARLPEITERLLAAGRPVDEPVAAVRWGTRPDQTVLVSTLGAVAEEARRVGLKPPAVVVFGEVVRLREQLAWYEARPLFGRVVALTRPAGKEAAWRDLLEEHGACVVPVPVIAIEAPPSFGSLDEGIARLPTYDLLVFTSAEAVRVFFERLRAAGKDGRALAGVEVAVVGKTTARALEARGIVPDRVPTEQSAEGLLAALGGRLAGRRVLMPRAEAGRETFPSGARALGAEVDVPVAYRTVARPEAAEALAARLASAPVDAVVFTSPSAVRATLDGLGDDARRRLGAALLVCIGPTTAAALDAVGLPGVVPPEPSPQGILAVLLDRLAAEPGEP
ncbi:MAG: uroporphyrinogen-III C-methyltransferase [Deltaproteobacteria bacterium]|nr:MAG: uroporphyrinogen-III C-methyltransferase [Deltaproteobacteria bacterium]